MSRANNQSSKGTVMNKKEVSLSDIFSIIRRKWWLILLVAMIAAAGAAALSIKTYTPVYKSNVLFYVKSQKTDDGTALNNDINSVNWALKVINSYTTLIHTNSFTQMVKDEYSRAFPEDSALDNLSTKTVKTMIAVSSVEDTNLFKVSVSALSAQTALRMGQCIENITPGFIEEKTGMSDAVTVADRAILPQNPDNSKHMTRNTLIGFALGSILTYLVLFFIDLFDVRIKSEEDLVNNYTLPIIGTVPTFETPTNRKKVYKYGD